MASEAAYSEQQWTIHSLSGNAAVMQYEREAAYAIGATRDLLTLKVLHAGDVVEDVSVCHSHAHRSLIVSVTAGDSTTRLQAGFDGGSVALRYFRNNELVLDEDTAVFGGYSAPARKVATDRQVYEQAVHLRRLIDKLQADAFFRTQVLRSVNRFAAPSGQDPVDYCDWVCKQCWHGMYLPHSCIACIFCNGFTIDTGHGGID